MVSIRRFLLVNLLLGITVVLALTTIGDTLLTNHDIEKHLNSQLAQTGQFISDIFSKELQANTLSNLQENVNQAYYGNGASTSNIARDITQENNFQFYIWNNKESLLIKSPEAPRFALPKTPGFQDQLINQTNWRTYTTYNTRLGTRVTIGENLKFRTQLSQHIVWDNLIILLFTYPILALLIWFVVGHVLNSVKKLAKALAKRSATELSPIEHDDLPAEVKPMIEALNKLFLRLHEAFERNKRFSGDAAHELRTPLAALKTQAQVALLTTDKTEQQAGLAKVIIGADRCTHIVQQLLALSRFDSEVILNDMRKIDLAQVTTEITALLVPFALEKNIEIELHESDHALEIRGDDTALNILIRNLIDNAIRYTPKDGSIDVHLMKRGNYIVLKVIDNGPGIAPELQKRVFERFYRVLGNKTSGSGLGLAIVSQIANLHHAKVELNTPKTGKGLEVSVYFPSVK